MFEFVGLQGYQEALLDSDNYLGSGNAMDAFNATQTDVFYPECNAIITDADIEAYYSASPCPPGSNGTNCRLNWKRNKVNLPNVLETGVFGMPLRKFDPISPTGWKMVQNSSNFDLSLFLSRSIVRLLLKIDSFKGTIRGTCASSIDREDNTLCNFRYALLVDFFQDLEINPFVTYLSNVTSTQDTKPF